MYQARIEPRFARHRVRGIDYHVTEWGADHDPLLVFLHGFGDAGSTFQFVVDELRKDWFVIAPDWRGFGESGASAGGYWFPDYLADLDALLRIYSPKAGARLVGHSMGANVATLYSGIIPERVSALINIEGFGLPDSEPSEAPARYRKWIEAGRSRPGRAGYRSFEELVPRIAGRSPGLSKDKALFVAHRWAKADADGVVRIRADPAHKLPNAVLYRRAEAIACWRQVTAPALIVVGVDSGLASDLVSSIDDSQKTTIAGAGHMVHFDQPARLAEAIETFLETL